MKLTMTFDYSDNDPKLGARLEACIRFSVSEFNRSNANDSVSVYRVREFTDARFREILEKAYGGQPRSRAAWVRRWQKVSR